MLDLKLVAVGDRAAGKTCLFIAYTTNSYPKEYIPTVFDNYSVNVIVGGVLVSVCLCDAYGNTEDYDRLRPLSYPFTDVFLVCFSVGNRESLPNVTRKWIPELRHHCPKTPIILVACQIDLRHKCPDLVTYEEGSKFASDLGLPYIETSALTQQGVKDGFDTAIRAALLSTPKKITKFQPWCSCSNRKEIPTPPAMPPASKAPWIEVETSRFAEDWMAMHENPVHADVTFVMNGQHNLDAHKIVLCSASKYFRQIFGLMTHKMKKIKSLDNIITYELTAGLVPGIVAVCDKDKSSEELLGQGRRHTLVELSADIKPKTFVRILEFLYAGLLRFTNDKDMIEQDELADVMRIADMFEIPRLRDICQNYLSEQEFLNPSIATCVNEETKETMKEIYFNKPEMADVTFKVEGRTIYAHKSVLCTRCRTMAAMFGDRFVEGQATISEVNIPDTSAECFLALLEYLYTDHAPAEDIEATELLVLADRYGVKRLVDLCELYIAKEVDRSVTTNIEKAEIDVIGILHTSQKYNAKQLSRWCLHFISTNYMSFQHRLEFSSLKGDNKPYIEENRWPPTAYLREVETYEKRLKDVECSFKCSII
ncbi:rho-related protein racA-like [Mizuhopecten yessoensis]|uniref:Rho-related protein racA n=1 Tax=Mizuhopecten yessoensis TaxID=6573 RepID=A0A210PC46_MIZYE|nr:rho-related protein racA-like [Mizuhopecten yessoensis]XP_021345134.1 rho-related protein racA-like [Mizuhopecten yessoensis]OWF34060.1 Rho-related protein racA [Mizuhopecten yessoensis]